MAHKQSLVLDVMLPELQNVNSCSKGYFWRTNVDNSVKVRQWTELVDTSCANLCKKCWVLTNFMFSHILHGYFRHGSSVISKTLRTLTRSNSQRTSLHSLAFLYFQFCIVCWSYWFVCYFVFKQCECLCSV